MIRAENVDFSYGKEKVLRDINLTVERGDILSVLGPNGCGKSTLLKLLRGLLSPDQGKVQWQGRDVACLSRKQIAQLVAVVPQTLSVPFPYPVYEIVAMGRFACRNRFFSTDQRDRKAIEKALAVTDTVHLAERMVTDLSGGELQRVILARALAQEAPVLLLDEATSNLDLEHRLEFSELLVRLNREMGTTIVQISHDLDQAAELSKRILLLDSRGCIAALGSVAEVFTKENLRQVFRVETQIDHNPYSGALRVYPVSQLARSQQRLPRIHLLCGGGSGRELLRRLNLAGAEISVGPLNRGDSDQILASALGVATIIEESFCPISTPILQQATEYAQQADILIVAATAWGPGNLPCLDIVENAVREAKLVLLVDPDPKRDFTAGKAWQILRAIEQNGGQVVPDAKEVFDRLFSFATPENLL